MYLNAFILFILTIFLVSLFIGGAMIPIAGGAAMIAVIVAQLITSETDIKGSK